MGENKIIKMYELMKMSYEFSRYIMKLSTELELIQMLCNIICEHNCGKYVWIGKAIDDENKTIKPIAASGFDLNSLNKYKMSWGDSEKLLTVTGENIKRNKPLVYRNNSENNIEHWKKEAKKMKFNSSIAIPIIINKKSFGAIYIYSEDIDSFDEYEINCLEKMIIDLEISVEKIRLMKGYKATATLLKQNEKKLKEYFEMAPEGIVITDEKANILEVNMLFGKITGYSNSELIGNSLKKLIPQMEEKNFLKEYTELLKRGEVKFILPFITKNNRKRYGSIKSVKLSENRLLGFLNDVTPKVEAENKLKYLKEAMDCSIDGMAILDNEYNFLYLNKAYPKLYGYEKADDLIDKSWRKLYTKEEMKRLSEDLTPDFLEKGFWRGETTGKRKDGSLYPQDISLTTISDGGIIAIVRDISEKNKIINEKNEAIDTIKKNHELFIKTLIRVIELRDPYTSGHQQRVADMSVQIAKKLGLSNNRIEAIRVAALLHDIGKIYIPTEILNKAAKLSNLEYSMVKEHTRLGYELIKDLKFDFPVAEFVLQHHERINGTGYPNQLTKNEIHLESKILAVADVVEAISSHRPYRPSLGIEEALKEIETNSGILYDENIVEACIELFKADEYKILAL